MSVQLIKSSLDELTSAVSTKNGAIRDLRTEMKAGQAEIDHKVNSILRGTAEMSPGDRKYFEAFGPWVQNPMANQRALDAARKDVSQGTDAAGGFGLPKPLANLAAIFERDLCPWLDPAVCGLTTVTSGDYHQPVSISDAVGARTTENGVRGDNGTSTFREVAPVWGEYYTQCVGSNHAREDIVAFETYLAMEFAKQRAALLANDIVRGTGTNGQVLGVTTTTPTADADSSSPIRAEKAIQYVPIQGDTSPLTLQFKDIANLLGEFKEAHLQDPSFHIIMQAATWRTMVLNEAPKEAALLAPRNPTLFGYPVKFSGAVDAIGANKFPVLAGAWRAGLVLVDRGPMKIIVDPTTPGWAIFNGSQRIGATVRDNNAIKAIKYAVS